MSAAWARLGAVPPKNLSGQRLELHHAAQIVSSVGSTHLPPRGDDSHTNLEWLPEYASFGAGIVEGSRPFRAAISPSELVLRLLDGEGKEARRLPLAGKTLDEGYVWMAEVISAETGRPTLPLSRPTYELPDHGVAMGERFSEPMEGFHEVGRWYADAAALLRDLMSDFSNSSPVRCWPHHFDIAMLLTVAPGKTVGIGLSPGDATYAEPYWYVTPYPYPNDPVLPPLPENGRWHTEGFFAAVLTGSDLLSGDPTTQRERSERFLRDAVTACRRMAPRTRADD